MKKLSLMIPLRVAAFTGSLLSAGAVYAQSQTSITAEEMQRRLGVCLAAEDWLKAACLTALSQADLTVDAPVDDQMPLTTVEADADAPDVELHMIGIYEPRPVRLEDGQVRRGNVDVTVDRPGENVVLALTSYEAVNWNVTATAGTRIDRIILGGHNLDRSDVTLNDADVEVENRSDIRFAYRSEGPRFNRMYQSVAEAVGVQRAASFQGDYKAPEGGFTIGEAPGVPTQQDILDEIYEDALDRSSLPENMQAVLRGDVRAVAANWRFDETGFIGIDANGRAVAFSMPTDLPEVVWPGDVAYDPDGQRLWVATYGGEGFLYEYDIANNRWSAQSMNQKDAAGLIFDPVSQRLIGTPGTLPGSPYFVFSNGSTLISTPQISLRDYPGLMQAFDAGNGPSPSMHPLAVDGDKVLVRPGFMRSMPETTIPAFLYLVDIGTGDVQLVR